MISLKSQEQKNKEVIISSATRTPLEQNKNIRKSAVSASKDQTKVAEVERSFLLALVRQFWGYTKTKLYPNIILSEPEETEVLNHI